MDLTLAFGFGGPQDLIIAFIVVVLIVAGYKLAELGKHLGGGPGGPKAA